MAFRGTVDVASRAPVPSWLFFNLPLTLPPTVCDRPVPRNGMQQAGPEGGRPQGRREEGGVVIPDGQVSLAGIVRRTQTHDQSGRASSRRPPPCRGTQSI